jgi:serine-type D-Ala-D-Ala carboxypeptidase (penicillin-binding protein 5/6)
MKLSSAIFLISFCFSSAHAAQTPNPPEINAKAWAVYDFDSGKFLAESNSTEKLQPASITKVMTAYLTLRAIKEGTLSWDEPVTASPNVRKLRRDESKMYLFPKEKVKVRELFRGLVVASANDAAITLAERISGSQKAFTELMTATAREIGMKDTHFSTPSGMTTPDNYTTARDLVILAKRLTEEFPVYYEYSRQQSFQYRNYRKAGRPEILNKDPFADGIKNGYTSVAGYCTLASSVRPDPERPGSMKRVFTVILGAPSKKERRRAARKLFDFAFESATPQN